MAIERQSWRAVFAWDALNALATRIVDVLDGNDRVALRTANSTATLALGRPQTLVESDTTAGAVVLTLPDVAGHVGYVVYVVKTAGANALTVNGVTVTARAAWVSSGSAWRQVS